MAKVSKGSKFSPCWNCGVPVNFTFSFVRDGKKIWHWRDENREKHHCLIRESHVEVTSSQNSHLQEIMRF